MSDNSQRQGTGRKRYGIIFSVAAGLLMLTLLLLAPRRTTLWVSVDGENQWSDKDAPPRRRVVWKPAVKVPPLAPQSGVKDSLIRPQLADDGNTLYFTLRDAEGQKDIYRSRLVDGKWQPGTPVAELNTSVDDIGPVISADGKTLFLYSNRDGGHGGFDIYMSRRDGGEWSRPINLGTRINSPAHEYDPSFDSQHQQLFFATNRSSRMQRLIREGKLDTSSDAWRTTLRADLGLNKFDLYSAAAEGDGNGWSLAEPLVPLNLEQANEGAPFVDETGTFLYFVSDRKFRAEEETNFDIYRVRLLGRGELAEFENLGSGVNSADNEVEPALSEEGFRIYFSRNSGEEDDSPLLYALYVSDAVEVLEKKEWDTSNLSALLALLERIFVDNLFWWILSLLALALLAALIWYLREVSARRATVPAFLIGALLMHVVLGVGSFFLFFPEATLVDLTNRVRDIFVATKIETQDLHQSHKNEQEEYEKVADLETVETVQPTEVERQVTEVPSVPVPAETVITNVPAQLSEATVNERPDQPTTRPAPTVTADVQLQRRTPATAEMTEVEVEIEKPIEQQTSPRSTPQLVEVKVQPKQNFPPPATQPIPLQRSTVTPTTLLAEVPVEAEARPENVAVTTTPNNDPLQRRVPTPAVEPVEQLEINTEAVANNSTPQPAATPPGSIEVQVARNTTVPSPAASAMPLQRRTPALRVVASETPIEKATTAEPVAVSSEIAETQLNRVRPVKVAESVAETAELIAQDAVPTELTQASSVTTETVVMQKRSNTIAAAAPAVENSLVTNNLPRIQAIADSSTEGARSPDATAPQSLQLENPIAGRTLQRLTGDTEVAVEVETVALPESATAGDSSNLPKTAAAEVALTRRSLNPIGTLPNQIAAAAPSRLNAAVAAQAVPVPRAETGTETGLPASNAGPAITRRTSNTVSADPSETIETEQVAGLPGEANDQVGTPSGPKVQLARRAISNSGPTGGAALLVSTEVELTVGADSAALNGSPSTDSTATTPDMQIADASLQRSRREGAVGAIESIEAAALEPAAGASGGGDNEAVTISGVAVDVARPDGLAHSLALRSDSPLGGRFSESRPDLAIGALARVDVIAPVTGSPLTSQLTRRRAFGPLVKYAEDNIGLQALLRLRQTDDQAKKDLIKAFGGSDETLASIKRGLEWLSIHQHEDGHWSLHQFNQACKNHEGKSCNGGGANVDTAGTAFALLPFLGDGHTHVKGTYKEQVHRGLLWLMEHQKNNGDLFTGGDSNSHMYSHGVATIALCEAYALTKDEKIRGHAQMAIDFIVASQNPNSGGWRYHPGEDGDTSVLGWQVMALKSAQMAGLNVPEKTLELSKKWIDRVSAKGDKLGQFGYTQSNDIKPAMSAEALLVLQYLGTDRNDERLTAGADYLLKNLPKKGKENTYYWYYGTQVMYHMQGPYWDQWNDAIIPAVRDGQHEKEGQLGSWDPKDQWESKGGRIYSTSLRLLMMEVYYRHLPLYQLIGE